MEASTERSPSNGRSRYSYSEEDRFRWTEIVRITNYDWRYLDIHSKVSRFSLKRWCSDRKNGSLRVYPLPNNWYRETDDRFEFTIHDNQTVTIPKKTACAAHGAVRVSMEYKLRVCAAKFLTNLSFDLLGKYVGHIDSIRWWWLKYSDQFLNSETPNLYGLQKEVYPNGQQVVPFVTEDGRRVQIPVKMFKHPTTDTEKRVREYIAQGLTTGEIYRRLNGTISELSVRQLQKQMNVPIVKPMGNNTNAGSQRSKSRRKPKQQPPQQEQQQQSSSAYVLSQPQQQQQQHATTSMSAFPPQQQQPIAAPTTSTKSRKRSHNELTNDVVDGGLPTMVPPVRVTTAQNNNNNDDFILRMASDFAFGAAGAPSRDLQNPMITNGFQLFQQAISNAPVNLDAAAATAMQMKLPRLTDPRYL